LTLILNADPPVLTTAEGFSPQFVSFVTSALTKDYKQRPNFKKLLVSPTKFA